MDQHLSLSEAKKLTGKSESTLKRFLREITSSSDHPDRRFILPPPEDIERRKAANEPYAWRIDRQLLLRQFPVEEEGSAGNARAGESSPQSAAPADLMLQILRDQLQSKDQQIRTLEVQLDRKDEQISNLNERMRESNVLMRELQQKLALPTPKPESGEPVIHAQPSEPAATRTPPTETSPQEHRTSPAKPSKPAPKKSDAKSTQKQAPKPTKKKRGFLGRLFLGAN